MESVHAEEREIRAASLLAPALVGKVLIVRLPFQQKTSTQGLQGGQSARLASIAAQVPATDVMQFSFSISDLKKSVPGAAELSSLQGSELVERLRVVLGKVAEGAQVTVDGEMVTIIPDPVTGCQAEEAQRLTEKAVARARRGEYEKAAAIYQRVMELDPHRQDARRDLAMVLVEMGRAAEAVDTLIDVLKANPKDHQALIVLGNHYARARGDLVTATRFLERAAELAPDDATAHNSLGGVLFEQKRTAEALEHFDRALELNPKFGHAYYGKSLLLTMEGRFADSLGCLRALFAEADSADARVEPMLAAARESFLKLSNIVANNQAGETFKAVENLKAQAARESGYPVVVSAAKLPGTLCGTTQMAWKYRRDHHVIVMRSDLGVEMLRHHVLSHECWHVLLESRARKAGVNRWLVSDAADIARVVDAMKPELRRMARTGGHEEDGLEKLATKLVGEGIGLLYNAPLDMLIERRIRAMNPEMREAQYCSLYLQMHNAARYGLDRHTRSVVPAPLLRVNDALNGAMALFVDELSGGASEFFAAYEELGNTKLARRIHVLCSAENQQPGSEYALVDAVAEMLGVTSWFGWRADPGDFEIVEKLAGTEHGGVTNPALLKQKSSEALPFLLGALRRFDRMDDDAIKRLTLEAAMAGQEGLDYADAALRHELKALPGERLSGLEVMCLLYAGMKRLAPGESGLGLDLNDEFAMALELFHSQKESR